MPNHAGETPALPGLRVASGEHKPRAFLYTEHQIHVLHGLACRAFHKVVYRYEHNHSVAVCGPAYVNKVGVLYPVDVGRAVNQTYEKFFAVKIVEQLADTLSRHLFGGRDVDRSEYAAHGRQRMRLKYKAVCGLPFRIDRCEQLFDFGLVLVLEGLVSVKAVGALRMMSVRGGLRARPRRACF